jgi:hypothetical protein
MTVRDRPQADVAVDLFTDWLVRYGSAMAAGDAPAVGRLFRQDGHWRDILSFTWAYRTFTGPAEIEPALLDTLTGARPRDFRVAADRMAPRIVRRSARTVVEGFFDFDTGLGRNTGFPAASSTTPTRTAPGSGCS